MNHTIKAYQDQKDFKNILQTYFINKHVSIDLNNQKLHAEYNGFSDGKAAFKIYNVKNVPSKCVIISKNKKDTIYAYLTFIEKQGQDVFIFEPEKFHYISPDNETCGCNEKKLVYVTNIISDFIIDNSISQRQHKIDNIKDIIKEEIGTYFDYIKIYFSSEGRSDPRMKYFLQNIRPIHLNDIQNRNNNQDKKFFDYYNTYIYLKDHTLKNRKNLTSEISIPLLYQTKMLYGYLQINNNKPMNDSVLLTLKKFSQHINELLKKSNILYASPEHFIVNNISHSGFGIVFNEKKYFRYFKENSQLYLDMYFPGQKKAAIMTRVKHITFLKNKTISVGFAIEDVDALSQVYYDEYIDTLTI